MKSGTKPVRNKGAKKWDLRLFVGGQTARSVRAFENLKRICEEHLTGNYWIEVVDLVKRRQLAAAEQIIALPTLVSQHAGHVIKLIGDLSGCWQDWDCPIGPGETDYEEAAG
ncbi:MAG: circadian clock protein KaiB [Acidobacteria bacterium]|nr:MAG: circadian clock protein KaiB [Acidobacteriota bacterium]